MATIKEVLEEGDQKEESDPLRRLSGSLPPSGPAAPTPRLSRA